MIGKVSMSGDLKIRKISMRKAPLSWRIRNALRWPFLWGWMCFHAAKLFTGFTGVVTITSHLALRKRGVDGEWTDYGIVGYREVTDTGVAFLVDDWDDNTTDITTMNFHGVGTGTTAEEATDTALETESTTIINPNSTRATGVKSQPAANQLRSTGTIAFDGSGAITEHGLLSQEATGGGVLWDRTVFGAVNVVNGESIVAQYTLTINSGG